MDVSSISVGSGSLGQWATFASLALPIVFALSLIFVMWRTQSLHFLVRRFWLLVHGKKDIPDVNIRAFVEEQTSLYAFRLFSGVKVGTLENAKQLMAWCKRHSVPMAQISLCGDCFDPDKRKVVEKHIPPRWRIIGKFCLCMCFVILGVLSAGATFVKASVLQIKATDRLVLMSESHARVLSPLPMLSGRLDIGDCGKQFPARIERTHLTAQEVEILCGIMKNPEWGSQVKPLISEQRWSFFWLMLMFVGLIYLDFLKLSKWQAAKALLERNLSKEGPACAGLSEKQ